MSLKSIVHETLPDVELVENLLGKFIEANHSKMMSGIANLCRNAKVLNNIRFWLLADYFCFRRSSLTSVVSKMEQLMHTRLFEPQNVKNGKKPNCDGSEMPPRNHKNWLKSQKIEHISSECYNNRQHLRTGN